jgi:exodeoxyribonuclease V alpha subunit
LGTEYLNEYFQKVLNPTNGMIEGLKRGDRVIVNQNVYNKRKEMIASNGVIGVIYDIERMPDNTYCLVDTANSRVLLKREHLELAYALTVHKFQGSECDYAVFILPDKEKIREDFITEEMMLVGKTRGRIKTFVLEVGLTSYFNAECYFNTKP